MAGDKSVYVTYIRATPQKIWDALRDPEFTKQYWVETWQESEWKKGASWKIMLPDGRVGDSGEILEYDPPKKMVISWRNEFLPDLKEEGYSRCTYELEPIDDCVKVTVTHEIDKPNSKLIAGVSKGWPGVMAALKTLLETGKPLEHMRKWPEGK